MFKIEIDGEDVVVRKVIVTCFGGGDDPGDDGKTESGVMNDGSNPTLLGCALPIRSGEAATRQSPLACSTKPHIPWGTVVKFWRGDNENANPVYTTLIDNGPDVQKYPTHAGDLTVHAASLFCPSIPRSALSNDFEQTLSYRISGGAKYLPS